MKISEILKIGGDFLKKVPQAARILKEQPSLLMDIYNEMTPLMQISKYLEECIEKGDKNYNKHLNVIKQMSSFSYEIMYNYPDIASNLYEQFGKHVKKNQEKTKTFMFEMLKVLKNRKNNGNDNSKSGGVHA